MIDCNKYNLTENINSCFAENWWQTWDFWEVVGFLIIVGIVAYIWVRSDMK